MYLCVSVCVCLSIQLLANPRENCRASYQQPTHILSTKALHCLGTVPQEGLGVPGFSGSEHVEKVLVELTTSLGKWSTQDNRRDAKLQASAAGTKRSATTAQGALSLRKPDVYKETPAHTENCLES